MQRTLLLLLIIIGMINVWVWAMFCYALRKNAIHGLKTGLLGSSFYLIVAVVIYLQLEKIEPPYPGFDTFMVGLLYFIGMFVMIIAFITCLIFTSYKRKDTTL